MTLKHLAELKKRVVEAHEAYRKAEDREVYKLYAELKTARYEFSDACDYYVSKLLRDKGMLKD